MKKRKKYCTTCGRYLWLRDFYTASHGWRTGSCKECIRKAKREEYARNRKKPNGVYYDAATGRVMEHNDCSKKIHWSAYMIERLKRDFATTKNADLAVDFNMSERTVIRKARELGLTKDPAWMKANAAKNCQTMRLINMCQRNSGMIKKGEHKNINGEFKKKKYDKEIPKISLHGNP